METTTTQEETKPIEAPKNEPPPVAENTEKKEVGPPKPEVVQKKPIPKPQQKFIVSKILKDRKKQGEEQLLVVYSHEKSEKGHWVAKSTVDNPTLIEEYFAQKAKEKAEGAAKKGQMRQLQEIYGIVPKNGKISLFEVKFKDSEKREYVPISLMHKHYSKMLISFYESHIEPQTPTIEELPQ
ncbi:hypothetical protein GPJ56_009457 [Histomonas meleagridis]|uniref:uncharacterized protein n=1 Tax=Histomonas meleagridis TaxID=135588 RepID=UPI003559FC49|nr:hypothetical protein GPJ56_009457 [Histomonas meleagridis]KAH0800332.1 hypothetical protein GO595_006921 [Histomonas meleagridis]